MPALTRLTTRFSLRGTSETLLLCQPTSKRTATSSGTRGSQADSRAAIGGHLRPVFADHPTAAYVAKVREIRSLGPGVGILRAVVGMVPPGSDDLNPTGTTIQTLVAGRSLSEHGRPQDSAALTEELRDVLRRGLTTA